MIDIIYIDDRGGRSLIRILEDLTKSSIRENVEQREILHSVTLERNYSMEPAIELLISPLFPNCCLMKAR